MESSVVLYIPPKKEVSKNFKKLLAVKSVLGVK
jgi:hypothetical protein